MADTTRYAALGDSISEGWCDPIVGGGEPWFGWADRLAILLDRAASVDGGAVGYANLAMRGRRIDAVVDDQVPAAIALRPHLASVMIGGNDLLLPKADPDALVARLEAGVAALRAAGATVLVATSVDPLLPRIARPLRGRFERFTAGIRALARAHEAIVLDLWRMSALRDPAMWAEDRIHLSAAGHRLVAAEAARTIGLPTAGAPTDPRIADTAAPTAIGDLLWARRHLLPWVGRRIRGVSSGDGMTAKLPEPVSVRGWWRRSESEPLEQAEPLARAEAQRTVPARNAPSDRRPRLSTHGVST